MRLFPLLLALSFLLLPSVAAAQPERPRQTSALGNAYFAGGDLRITSPVAGDLIAAGGRLSIEAPVGADAALAGGTVDVRAPIREDLRAAGGSVTISQSIGADLVAAGGSVQVDRTARIGGSAWLAGSDVRLAGAVGENVQIYANRIVVDAEIAGDVRLAGQEIELTPAARIGGNLNYASPQPPAGLRPEQVGGAVTRQQTPEQWREGRRTPGTGWLHPVFWAAMLAFGAVLTLLFPAAANGVARTLEAHPWRSLLLGLALVFTVPPVAVMTMVTIIGLPVGLSLLLLYPIALLLGYLATAFFLSRRAAIALRQGEAPGRGRRILFLALALLVLSLLLAIPFLGPLVAIVATVAGAGALLGWAYLRIRWGPDATARPL
ncbi:MAG TPA: hypothetical protein VM406_04315 [Noviherbaspirillum sp.]|nr:hypothetical protein [Noviherbaspirillum sp.]